MELIQENGCHRWYPGCAPHYERVLTARHIPELKRLGIASVNLSMDTLDRDRFKLITRRDEFDKTMRHYKPCFIMGYRSRSIP